MYYGLLSRNADYSENLRTYQRTQSRYSPRLMRSPPMRSLGWIKPALFIFAVIFVLFSCHGVPAHV